MKLDRKGFMLAEVAVVAVVVAVVLVTLFSGLNNVSSAYETRSRYYDVDSLYVATECNDILIRNNVSLNGIVNNAELLYNWASGQESIDEDNIRVYEEFYSSTIGDTINTYISPYNKDVLLTLKSVDGKTDATFTDYLEYLSGNLDFEEDYDYMIIVERREDNNIDDCYYYALKLKY